MMIANIIVDVPSRQTDRPFDYEVPQEMQPWIAVGSRVGVPFGPRILQGFVISFSEHTDYVGNGLKQVAELLDPVPPLLPDLIELADWLSEKYCCSKIAALQVMLPTALKGKEEKHISIYKAELASNLETQEICRFIEKEGGQVLFDKLLAAFPNCTKAIKLALQLGVLQAHSTVKDKINIKKMLTVYPPENIEEAQLKLPELIKRAPKQFTVLQFMLEHQQPITLQQLLSELQVTASTVHSLADKGLLRIVEEEQKRDPYQGRTFAASSPLSFTAEQAEVYQRIIKQIAAQSGQTMLLHGVTGSGKTEVYLQSIQYCLEQKKQAIVLVPEISLTPQMVERFKSRFGEQVAVMHSRLSAGERYDEWRKIRSNEASVVVGARSAIFAPFKQIGLIIIDEEHESSYKQEDTPKYHARDVAVHRAKQHGAVVVLGSATPSMETYAAAVRQSEQALLSLPNRVHGRPLPSVEIVDMREQLQAGNRSMFSKPLYNALQQRLERGEQSVLLLNRRGYSTFVMCRTCGYVATCPHCDISLTFHQKVKSMRCHYCGYAESVPATCPSCSSEHIRFFGTGTQKVEEELAKLFPGIRVIRMDVDTTTEKNAHEKLLNAFGERKADVLLGTQMVAKGLDFPYVTLVGVITADSTLNLPDFRAAERAFQLITQVAGRAGRHELTGEVIVQTYTPDHYAILAAQTHSYEQFVEHELRLRGLMSYPPYCRLILINMSHESLPLLSEVSSQFVSSLTELAQFEGILVPLRSRMMRAMEILGPVTSPIARIKDRYRYQCVIKYRGSIDATSLVKRAMEPFLEGNPQKRVQFVIDVDPQVIM